MKYPAPRLVERSSSQNVRSPRKARNIEADEVSFIKKFETHFISHFQTTPPSKRSNSASTPKRSPMKPLTPSSKKKEKAIVDDDDDME